MSKLPLTYFSYTCIIEPFVLLNNGYSKTAFDLKIAYDSCHFSKITYMQNHEYTIFSHKSNRKCTRRNLWDGDICDYAAI